MVTLEQKIDLIMQLAVAKDSKEKTRLKNEIAAALADTDPSPAPASTANTHAVDTDALMTNIIDDLFKELGAPCHLIGYDRTAYAIKLVISDNEYIHDIAKRLYPAIGAKYNTTASRVERSIRHLIEVAWSRHDIQDAYRIFGNTIDIDRGKPTNSEFIATCARIVKRRMREKM